MRSQKVVVSAVISLLAGVLTGWAQGINSVDYPDKIAVGLDRPLRVSLDGAWKFQTDAKDLGEREQWFQPGKITERVVKVPLPWELAADDLRNYSGAAWYQREVEVPRNFAGKRIALGFHGVAHLAKVYVNGKLAGEHTGAQAPFLLDITRLVRPGERNVVTVRVFNPQSGVSYYMDTHSLLKVSGIWRSVWIEATGKRFISDLFMIPDIDKSQATARVCVYVPTSGKSKEKLQLTVVATDPNGKRFEAAGALDIDPGSGPAFHNVDLLVKIPGALLWDLDNPNLYSVEARLADGQGKVVDTVRDDFGMRKFEARAGRFWLNNRQIYLVGGGIDPLPYGGSGDVNWFLPGPYSYPSDEETQSDIKKIKALGVNLARVPLRPMHPQWLHWADRLGILVWQEASWTKFNDLKGYQDTWSEVLLRDRNHPSAVIWTLFNESWGYEYADPIYEHVEKLDPTRLVLDNTGGLVLSGPNYPDNHRKTDFEDVHCYPGFNRFSKNYWLSLQRVDQNNPLMVTEFGPIPYMFNVEKFRQVWGGKDPWWFDASPVRPLGPRWNHHGIQDRYSQWGFDKIYGDWDKFTEAHDWYYFWGLKDQTQAMRMNPELGGFVAWIWDNGQHGTGAIDNFKEKKIFADELAKIWTQDLVILEKQRHNYWSGEKLYANLHVSHFSDQLLQDARVTWWLEDSDIRGEAPGVTMPSGEVRLIGDIAFTVPDVSNSVMKKLYARLQTKEGKTLSENYEPVWIYPARYRHASDIDFTISGITSSSYKVVPIEQRPRVVVATKTDDKIKTFLREGGTVILFPGSQAEFLTQGSMDFGRSKAFFPEGQDEILKRNGLELGSSILGGHTDTFYARKGLGVFDRIPYENPYTWQFYAIWPKTQIFGLKPESHEDTLAGGYMNLLNRQCATVAQFRCGKGRLILCTFNLLDATYKGLMVRNDPAAVIILNDLLKYAAGDFQPRTELALD